MKIQKNVDVQKSLTTLNNAGFEVMDFSDTILTRKPLRPRLLSTLLAGFPQTDFFTTTTFVHDAEEEVNALPANKQYQEYGARTQKGKAMTYRWGIPSFGISANISPADWANKRIAGTDATLDSEARHVLVMEQRLANSWELFLEQQLLHLITTDSNDVGGGVGVSYNFWNEIVGSTPRTHADFAIVPTAPLEPMEVVRLEKKRLIEELMVSGEVVNEIVVICGSDFFQAALDEERNVALVRELRSSYDFASQEVTSDNLDGTSFPVDNFYSALAGVRFIEYSVGIGGIGLAPEMAYMLPVRAEKFIRKGYAPAQTRQYANTSAQAHYAWVTQDDRQGVTRWEESNVLMTMVNPRLLRTLKLRTF